MNKLEILMDRCPEQVEELVNKLYSENFKKKGKTIFHFGAIGKIYDSNKFVDNYINFLKDVSKIHSYEFFKLCIPAYYISRDSVSFSESHIERNCIVNICEGFYVSTYSSTEKKIEHIKNICEMLGVNMIEM